MVQLWICFWRKTAIWGYFCLQIIIQIQKLFLIEILSTGMWSSLFLFQKFLPITYTSNIPDLAWYKIWFHLSELCLALTHHPQINNLNWYLDSQVLGEHPDFQLVQYLSLFSCLWLRFLLFRLRHIAFCTWCLKRIKIL